MSITASAPELAATKAGGVSAAGHGPAPAATAVPDTTDTTGPAAEPTAEPTDEPTDEPTVPSRHLSLSPSRAADFKACPLRYRFRVVDRLPETSSPAAVRGTLVHSVLESLFELSPGERTLDAARGLIPGAWAALQESDPAAAQLFAAAVPADLPDPCAAELETAVDMARAGTPDAADTDDMAGMVNTVNTADDLERTGSAAVTVKAAVSPEDAWLTSAAGLLANYFVLEDPQRLAPAAREEYVEADLGEGLRLRGVIDRLDESATGALRVVDYKTGSAPSEAWEGKALFQLKFYALVLWRTRNVVPAVLQLLYLTDTQKLTYAPDEAELVAFERQLRALWAAISQALDSGDFRARRGPLCKWCDHQALCPEFGGTPPAYPGLHLAVAPEPIAALSTAGLPLV